MNDVAVVRRGLDRLDEPQMDDVLTARSKESAGSSLASSEFSETRMSGRLPPK
jgi:hypothetical protein